MKKQVILILTYALVVVALIVSVKVAQAYVFHGQAISNSLIAGCSDTPPSNLPSE